MTRFGILTRARTGTARRRGRSWVLGALVGVLALVLAACNSTNTYPIDFFSEMHYQKSYKHLEPPVLDSPPGAVPYQGGGALVGGAVGPRYAVPITAEQIPVVPANYTLAEMRELTNPLGNDPAAIAAGRDLYVINCAVCHGENADGQGIAGPLIFQANNQPLPVDLRQRTLLSPETGQPAELTDGELFWVLTHGYPTENPIMPGFDRLLSEEQRWALVSYIRSIQTEP